MTSNIQMKIDLDLMTSQTRRPTLPTHAATTWKTVVLNLTMMAKTTTDLNLETMTVTQMMMETMTVTQMMMMEMMMMEMTMPEMAMTTTMHWVADAAPRSSGSGPNPRPRLRLRQRRRLRKRPRSRVLSRRISW
jgi:hypothetical protein